MVTDACFLAVAAVILVGILTAAYIVWQFKKRN
jgi:hypothetical protein